MIRYVNIIVCICISTVLTFNSCNKCLSCLGILHECTPDCHPHNLFCVLFFFCKYSFSHYSSHHSLQGRHCGNAVGFKISSLNKLIDTRANKPRMTLLHYLVNEAKSINSEVLAFADVLLPLLKEASR